MTSAPSVSGSNRTAWSPLLDALGGRRRLVVSGYLVVLAVWFGVFIWGGASAIPEVFHQLLGQGMSTDMLDPSGPLTLTLGSPLDKIAFIFRSQKPDEQTDIREELSAERQPMILEEEYRPLRWVNLSNPFDWIGADIDYFDLQPRNPDRPERVVENVVECAAKDPGTAHGGYWRRRAFQQLMLWGAAGCPGGTPPDDSYQTSASNAMRG